MAEANHKTMTNATVRGIRTKFSHGYWSSGFAPYGYKLGTNSTLELVKNEAELVSEVYERVAKGEKLRSIEKDFALRGLRTRAWTKHKGQPDERRCGAKPFRSDTLASMVRNCVYRGMVRCQWSEDGPDGIARPVEMDPYEPQFGLYKGKHAAIITDELWNRANDALAKQLRSPFPQPRDTDAKGLYLLQGIFRCGQCGAMMTSTSSKHGETSYRYYACVKTLVVGAGHGCRVRQVNAAIAHAVVVQYTARIVTHPGIIQRTVDKVAEESQGVLGEHKQDLKTVTEQLKTVREEIANLVIAIGKAEVPALSSDLKTHAEKLKEAESTLSQRQQDLAAMTRLEAAKYPDAAGVAAALADYTAKVSRLSGKEQKELTRLLIRDVTVYPCSPAPGTGNRRYRYVIRLNFDALMPAGMGAAKVALPMECMVESISKRFGIRFRFVEPFDVMDFEDPSLSPAAPSDQADAEILTTHPLIVVSGWKREMEQDEKLTQSEIARRIGKTRALVSEYFKLLKLPQFVLVPLLAERNPRVLRHFSLRKLLRLLKLESWERINFFKKEMKLALGA
jgi:hypothetical protein